MNQTTQSIGIAIVCLTQVIAFAAPGTKESPAVAPEVLSQAAARIIANEIPREYERSKDWGNTKKITTGVRSSGNFFKFDIHKKKKEVKHGVWQHYKLTLVDPDKSLHVEIENLRTLPSAKIALTLNVAAKVHGWARAKVYERGVHIISVEAEGDTDVRFELDAEIGLESLKTDSFLPTYAVDPTVTDARLKFDEFHLERVSDLKGELAEDLGIILREAVEHELKGNRLRDAINKSIDKHREKLQLSPEMLLGKATPKTTGR